MNDKWMSYKSPMSDGLTFSGNSDHEGSAVLHDWVMSGVEEDTGDVIGLCLGLSLGRSFLLHNLIYTNFIKGKMEKKNSRG